MTTNYKKSARQTMLRGAIAYCILVPAASSVIAGANAQEVSSLPKAVLEKIEASISTGLKDPKSAIFEIRLAIPISDGGYCIAGKVNARNSFGGYTGSQNFTARVGSRKSGYRLAGFAVLNDGATPDEIDKWVSDSKKICPG